VALSVADQGIPTLTAFIKTDLGLSASVAALIALSITGGKIIASYVAGRAADAFGERRMLLMGCLGAAITLVLAAWLPLPALVAGLVLSGVFIATSPSAGGRLISSSFPHGRRNFAIGIRQTGIPLGALVGAALLPWVAVNWGWQAAIATSGGVAGLGALAVLFLTEPGAETVAPRPTPTSLRTLLADRQLMIVFAWGCLLVSAQYAVLAYLALTVHAAAGTSLALATVVVIAAQAGGVLGRLGWGLVNDTAAAGRRRLLLVGISVSGTAAALLLALLPGRVSFSWMIVLGVVAGVALVGWQGMWTTVVMDIVGPADSGAAIGLGVTFIAVTALCLAPVYGLLADLTGSYAATWLAVAGVLAVATLVAAALPETDQNLRTA
jgi:MFS family permease